MKLHLPKQLFTALIAAMACAQLAIATEYTVTKGSTVDFHSCTFADSNNEAPNANGDVTQAVHGGTDKWRAFWRDPNSATTRWGDHTIKFEDEKPENAEDVTLTIGYTDFAVGAIIVGEKSQIKGILGNTTTGKREIYIGKSGGTYSSSFGGDFALTTKNIFLNGTQTWTVSNSKSLTLNGTVQNSADLTLQGKVNFANELQMKDASNLLVKNGSVVTATTITSSGSHNTNRKVSIEQGASVTTGEFKVAYNLGSVDVDGELEVTTELYLGSNNDDNVTSLLTGDGSVTATKFRAGNWGSYGVNVATLSIGSSGLVLENGAVLNLASTTTTVAGTTTVNSGNELNFNAGTATLTGAVTNNGNVNVNGGSVTLNGGISGTGTLELQRGSLTLGGTGNSVGIFEYSGGSLTYESLTAGTANLTSALSNSGHLKVTGILAGRIENTADGKVTLASGMSITADTNASITGAGITELGGTLTNNGALTLGGVISLSGDINQHYVVREAAGETGLYVLDYTDTTVTNTAGNGFKLTRGGSYWLVQGGTTNLLDDISSREGYTITQVTDANKAEDERVGDVYISSDCNVGREFYISSGSVDVGTSVQDAATGYSLQGGTMKLTAGSVNTSTITYTSGSITLSDGATLVLDAMPAGMTANSLLSGILSVARDEDERTQIGRLKITQETTLTTDFEATYTGAVEINNARLIAGEGPGQSVKLASISNFILNDGGELYYHADPTQAPATVDGVEIKYDIRKITVESGTGSFKLQDSGGASLEIGEISINENATFKFWSNWYDSDLNISALNGAGTFRVESSDNTAQSSVVDIDSLAGFTGSMEFVNDTERNLAVTIDTGTSAVNFKSLQTINTAGTAALTFSVQTDTSIGTLVVATGAVKVSDGKTLALGAGTAEAEKQHSIGTLSAAAAGVTLGDHATLTLGGGTAEAQKQHSIGTLSAAAAGVTLGDYATLTLGGGTAEAQKQHSIGTLTGGAGSYVNLAQHSVLNTITTASGVTLTGSGTYKLASGTSTMTSGMTLGADWMGTVVVENSTGKKDITKALNALGNSESTVQVTNLEGYFETARSGVVGVVDPNLHLVNGTNGESAIKLINGNCNGVNAVIAGDISGSGDITHQAWNGASDRYANYEFTGNVTQWTGNFIVGDSSFSGHANVIFSGSATKINAGFRMDDDANKLHLQIGKSDETDKQYEVNGVVSANALTAYQSADFTKEVTVGNAVTVSAGKTATFGSTLTANTVNNSGQIQLGKIVTNGEEKEMQVVATVAGGTMSKVRMSSTGITGTAQDGSSISDADIEVLAQDASFTIEDMTLSQVKLSAAQGTTVALNNLSGSAELAGAGHFSISGGEAQYTLAMSPVQAQVAAAENEKGSALTLNYTSGTAITMSSADSRLLLSADPTVDANGIFGTYNLTLTLNYTLNGIDTPTTTADWQELVGFTGILGDLLTAQTPEATVDLAEGEAAVAAAGTTPTVEYNYTAPQGDAQVGMLVITINGLNVPEPASATLGLAALMMLCARRRRKA